MSKMSASPARKAANLSLDEALLREARELDVNLSRAAENGVRAAVASAKAEKWKIENAGAIESSRRFVETHGLPLAGHRSF